MDLGPRGYFEQEQWLLVAALGVLRNKGVSSGTLDGIMDELSGVTPPSSLSIPLKPSPDTMDDIDFQFAASKHVNLLKRLMKTEVDRHKRSEAREFSSSLLQHKLYSKIGNLAIYRDLRNPLKRIKSSVEEVPVEMYFDCWSRLHTVYSHYSAATNDANSMVYHVIFDQTGDYILTASVDGLVKIFDKQLQLQTTIRGHKRDISILDMSSDNRFVVSADEGGIVRVWEFPTGECVAVLTEQEGHNITTLTLHTETVDDPSPDTPWKSFLITSSATYGLLIYEEKSFGRLLVISQE